MRAISVLLASTMASARVCCSRMIASTVMLPMMLRRCPLKIRPTRVGIWDWSPWNRRAAAAIDSWSSPTLNAMTAWTARVRPCWVKQSSTTSASCMARVSRDALEKTGTTNDAVPGDDLERQRVGAALLPAADQQGLVGSGHTITEHG